MAALAPRCRRPIQPPPPSVERDALAAPPPAIRACGPPPIRPAGARHVQQLRRRHHALGHDLTAEENIHGFFWQPTAGPAEAAPTGLGGSEAKGSPQRRRATGAWGRFNERFNLDTETNEPNRFGWIVEIDPTDPTSTPVKHTALGRFSHEGAECIVSGDGRIVLYSGDDARFEYIYRFVGRRPLSAG